MDVLKKLIFSLSLFASSAYAGPVWNPLPPEAYKFGELYPEAQHLLYAFDYGHALVYEKLLNATGIEDPEEFEKELLTEIFYILKHPPTIKVDEEDIAPQYVFTFPLTVTLFDWSHMLHQFVLDVLATSKDRGTGMKNRVREIFSQYKSFENIAITDVCKTMMFMDGHYFSKAFRRTYPSFNLLIWSYHWFQIKLYEALMKPTQYERDLAVQKTVDDFWELISDLPESAPFDMMPETMKEAPTFGAEFPRITAAFDNNHMLHDVVSDILVSPRVTDRRAEGMRTALMGLDPTAYQSNLCVEEK